MTIIEINKRENLELNIKNFSGPLDILYNLIKEKKYDILSLDLLDVVNQYLDYLSLHIQSIKTDEIIDSTGSGDAFNGAMLHAIMSGMPLGEATVFAISAFALKHIIKGDTFTLGEEDIVNYRKVLEECSE